MRDGNILNLVPQPSAKKGHHTYTLLKPKRHSLRWHATCWFTRTNAHAHQYCIFQSYAKTVPLRMTMKLTMRRLTL